MIPVGRSAIDRAGIAELHGMTWRQARRARPWAQQGHPAPLTRGRPGNGKPQMWDYEQAEQFARGEPVAGVGTTAHEGDLLDYAEAAEWAGVAPSAWVRDVYRGRVPPADEHFLGGSFWYRRTVDDWLVGRATPKPRSGRPSGAIEQVKRGEIPEQVRALLREAIETGEPISTAEIARRLGIHYNTARRHVSAIRNE